MIQMDVLGNDPISILDPRKFNRLRTDKSGEGL